MRFRAAKLLLRDHFVCHRLYHIRSGDEHIAAVFDHEDEVSHGGAVNRTARARPHDEADLRYHAACQDVALEHLGVTAERSDAFLNARATGIVETDNRGAHLHRGVHDLADLFRMALGKRATKDCEILGKNIDEPAIDRA